MRTLESVLDVQHDEAVIIASSLGKSLDTNIEVDLASKTASITGHFGGRIRKPIEKQVFKYIDTLVINNGIVGGLMLDDAVGGKNIMKSIKQATYRLDIAAHKFKDLELAATKSDTNYGTVKMIGLANNATVKNVTVNSDILWVYNKFDVSFLKEIKGTYAGMCYVTPNGNREIREFIEMEWENVSVSKLIGGKQCESIEIIEQGSSSYDLYISKSPVSGIAKEKALRTKDGWYVNLFEDSPGSAPARSISPVDWKFVLD